MKRTRTGPTRRHFALGLGASLLCAPFVDLLSRPARADPAPKADRLIVFFSPNGTVHRYLWPTGTETSFQFAPGTVLEALAPHASDLLVLSGIDFVGVNNHEGGMASMLTGGGSAGSVGGGASVDQYIAGQIGANTRFRSLEFGVQTSAWGGNVQTRMSYAAPGVFVTPEDSPKNAFGRIFGAATGTADAARLLRRRQSVLDNVRGEITALQGRLGKSEQAKLDQHLSALRELEHSLSAGQGGSCTSPQAPMDLDIYAHPNFPAVGKMQMDLLVMALRCGLTRVASIQWAHTIAPTVFSWESQAEAHHELSHKGDADATGVANFIRCERWFAEQFAYLLDALKTAPDPQGGTMLDRTLVVWAKEMGDSRLHTCSSVPFLLAGGGGALRTGRYLTYQGAPHQQLLTSICHAMGLGNASFGDASKGTGPLPGLT